MHLFLDELCVLFRLWFDEYFLYSLLCFFEYLLFFVLFECGFEFWHFLFEEDVFLVELVQLFGHFFLLAIMSHFLLILLRPLVPFQFLLDLLDLPMSIDELVFELSELVFIVQKILSFLGQFQLSFKLFIFLHFVVELLLYYLHLMSCLRSFLNGLFQLVWT